ncbi:hypothetical protein [Blautia sp.]|uniref:hypothetical protein n=1 Tax=Blautia sp. TaxID=1955243 RepID=UPI003AB7C9D7
MDFSGYGGEGSQEGFDSGLESGADNSLDSGFEDVSDEDFAGDLDSNLDSFESAMEIQEELPQDFENVESEDCLEGDLDLDLENVQPEDEKERTEDILETDLDLDLENETVQGEISKEEMEETRDREAQASEDEIEETGTSEVLGEGIQESEIAEASEEENVEMKTLEVSEEGMEETKVSEVLKAETEEIGEIVTAVEEAEKREEVIRSEGETKETETSEVSDEEAGEMQVPEEETQETGLSEISEEEADEMEASEVLEKETDETETSEVSEEETDEMETSEVSEETDEMETSEVSERETDEMETSEVSEETDEIETSEVSEEETDEMETSEVSEEETDVMETSEVSETETDDSEVSEVIEETVENTEEVGEIEASEEDASEKDKVMEFKTPTQIAEELHNSVRETWMKAYNPEIQMGGMRYQQERMDLYKQGLAEMGNIELSQMKELTREETIALYHSLQDMENLKNSANLSQEVKIKNAYEEIRVKRENEQAVYQENMKMAKESLEQDPKEWRRKFVTNDGREITYRDAVMEVQREAQCLLDKLETEREVSFEADIRKKLNEKILLSLAMQQKKTDQRGIGEHGIKHIYGNYQRTMNALSEQSTEVRLAGLISQVHHDEGYSTSEIHNSFDEKERRAAEKRHDVYSGAIFDRNHEKFYKEIFDRIDDTYQKDLIYGIKEAIEKHNTSRPEEIKKYVNPENKEALSDEAHMVVSAVHISDKIALGEREKMTEFYELPQVAVILQKVYELDSKLNIEEPVRTSENVKIYDYLMKKSRKAQEEVKRSLQDKIIEIVNKDESYPQELKQDFTQAIRKDVSQQSAKFVNSMNVVDTPADALKYVRTNKGIRAEINIQAIDIDKLEKSIGKNLVQRQYAKLFEDLGCSEAEKGQLAELLLKNGKVELEDQNIVVNLRHISLEQVEQKARETGVSEKRLIVRRELENMSLYECEKRDKIQAVNEVTRILSKGKEYINQSDILALKRCCNRISKDKGSDILQWIDNRMISGNYREAAYSLAVEMKENILKEAIGIE